MRVYGEHVDQLEGTAEKKQEVIIVLRIVVTLNIGQEEAKPVEV